MRNEPFPRNQKKVRILLISFTSSIRFLGSRKLSSKKKYVKNGRSIAQIAEETLSSRAAVRDALISFGIPLRKQGNPGLRPAQVRYGFRRSAGLLVPHLGEQRIIQSVRKMSSDGLSYRKICDFLTSVGVPTKNQGKGWQPEMIRRLLARQSVP